MSAPILHVIAGPNGSGKSTFFAEILEPELGLPLINADHIAAANWPEDAEARSYDAAKIADALRKQAITQRSSFVAETVFSHPSKLDLIAQALEAGYVVTLHAILVPEELSVVRVGLRTRQGGHSVPEHKIRSRYRRLWRFVREAMHRADEALVWDNSSSDEPFRVIAAFRHGIAISGLDWPSWTPPELKKKD